MSSITFSSKARLGALCAAVLVTGTAALAQNVTTVHVTDRVIRTGVKRFGINLSGQNFYDSGQMARNLIQRNPGFEGGTWQTILRCKHAGSSSCADENPYTQWPDGFMDGAHVQVLSGAAMGAQSVVTSSHAAAPPLGYSLQFHQLDRELKDDDFILVRKDDSSDPAKRGDPTAGWWTNFICGATAAAERNDLPPNAQGRQALRLNAAGACQRAEMNSFFDSFATHRFVTLHGQYTLSFRAKLISGNSNLHVELQRMDTHLGMARFLDKAVPLTSAWHDYTLTFRADDKPGALGPVRLQLAAEGSTLLLDDVSLTPARSARNPTAFRDEVVAALREYHPGILRFMDNGTNFGASLADLIAPPFARQRTGYSTQEKLREDIALGLPEVLELAAAVDAEPWISLPAGFSPWEMQGLIEYLSGPPTSKYGAKRAAAGHPKPWTDLFRIHLELGNEQWNSQSFSGAAIHDPTAYGQRAAAVFRAARTAKDFHPDRYDLVAGGWNALPWWTEQEAKALNGAEDSLAIAPYLFSEFNDASSTEAIFGPMLAQPEQMSHGGTVSAQAQTLQKFAPGKRLSVYEVNLGTSTGAATITQADINRTVPSLGGGLAVADHMLTMLRDLGITDQCFFALPEFSNGFASAGGPKRDVPLWGGVVDMGGSSNLERPSFLALAAINRSILGNMVAVDLSGPNPTWSQTPSSNDKITLPEPHFLQLFALKEGVKRTLILLNLSRDKTIPVQFAGIRASKVSTTVLTADHIDDNNETTEHVKLKSSVENNFQPSATRQLPPFSLTILRWTE